MKINTFFNTPMRIEHMSFHIPVASKSNKAIAFLLRVKFSESAKRIDVIAMMAH
jgi:hypothetical protein